MSRADLKPRLTHCSAHSKIGEVVLTGVDHILLGQPKYSFPHEILGNI